MILIRAIVRPEKAQDVMDALMEAGFPAVTKVDVAGRGRQKGVKIGEIVYDELPKQMLLVVVPPEDQDLIVKTVMTAARTGEGHFGDGKIFVSPVEQVYTISSGTQDA